MPRSRTQVRDIGSVGTAVILHGSGNAQCPRRREQHPTILPPLESVGHERRAGWPLTQCSQNPLSNPIIPRCDFNSAVYEGAIPRTSRNCVRPLSLPGSFTAILLSCLTRCLIEEGTEIRALAQNPGLKMPVLAVGAGGGAFTVDTMSKAAAGRSMPFNQRPRSLPCRGSARQAGDHRKAHEEHTSDDHAVQSRLQCSRVNPTIAVAARTQIVAPVQPFLSARSRRESRCAPRAQDC